MKNKILKFILVMGLVGIFVLALNIPAFSFLVLRNRKNPSQYVVSREAYKNGFVIAYTHSVNKGRVQDYYHVSEGQLELYKTIFVSYGAGIPEPGETEGSEFKVLSNGYEISNLHRIVPRLVMAVGIVANHSVILNDREYFLTDFFEPQTILILEIKRLSLINIITSRQLEATK